MKTKNRQPVYQASALAIFTSFGAQAYADATVASDADNLSEIVVTGVRQAMKDSIGVKKNSDTIGANRVLTAILGNTTMEVTLNTMAYTPASAVCPAQPSETTPVRFIAASATAIATSGNAVRRHSRLA